MSEQVSAKRVVEDLRVEIFRRRISQERLASTTGMSQSAISRRLNGDVDPTIGELMKIAEAAGMRVVLTLAEVEAAA